MKCRAMLMIEGENYPCDIPLMDDGTHGCFGHNNMEAQAIWISHTEAEQLDN